MLKLIQSLNKSIKSIMENHQINLKKSNKTLITTVVIYLRMIDKNKNRKRNIQISLKCKKDFILKIINIDKLIIKWINILGKIIIIRIKIKIIILITR